MRVALDTNVMVYAEGVNGPVRKSNAMGLVGRIPTKDLVIPTQTLGELYNVLIRKGGFSLAGAHDVVLVWAAMGDVPGASVNTLTVALALSSQHGLQIWDAIILAAAAEAECDLLLSEDLQDGFRWRGVTVVNPFAEPISPLLDAFLAQP